MKRDIPPHVVVPTELDDTGPGVVAPLVPLSQASVMMVDDEPMMTEVIQTYLEEGGYPSFVCTNNPREAVSMVRAQRPELLLLDLMMPEVSGFDILRELRADEELKYLPVIVLTAASDPAMKLKALDLGATEFLAKPVDASELVLRVRNTLAFKVYQDRLANFDPVTDLPNRRVFLRQVESAMAGARRAGSVFAVMHVDLDRFKQINDSFGYKVGDELLKRVAERLRRCVRRGDAISRVDERAPGMISRLGGDEFGILAPRLGAEDQADRIAQRILSALAAPFEIDGQELYATPSIGVAVFPGDGADPAALLSNAEAAMDHAKQSGRNRMAFYRKDLNERSRERLDLQSRLRHAVAHDELVLHYQPKLRIVNGHATGAEALLRWRHPELGMIPPAKFIPIAEESGLIVQIGEWVMREACRQAAEWARQGFGALKVALNLSGLQIADARMLDVLRGALSDSGMVPEQLILELTESTLMSDARATIELLNAMRALGPRIAVDDFGTGYSSLSYLKRFPLNELKIDRSFVMGLPDNDTDAAIIRAIVALAHSLDLSVVAEGVETQPQLALLHELGCDEFQGYLYSPPIPAEQFTQLLRRQPS